MCDFWFDFFRNYAYFNFDEEDDLKSVFEANKNPQRIIELLSMIAGEKIAPAETLIIFDEIQECPEALNALKYFKGNANEYHIIAKNQPKHAIRFSKRNYLKNDAITNMPLYLARKMKELL